MVVVAIVVVVAVLIELVEELVVVVVVVVVAVSFAVASWPLVGNEGMNPQYSNVKVDSLIPY